MPSSCGCITLNLVPIAELEADYSSSSGAIIRIRSNKSAWNETIAANTTLRQIRWFIFSNGYEVANSSFIALNQGTVFSGASKTPPSVSTGATLEYSDAEMDVKGYLMANNIPFSNNNLLEIACDIINGNNIHSTLSNRIVLNGGLDCCDDDDLYELVLNGTNYCATSPMGECYAQA